MKELEQRILQTGRVINNEILKVDHFLNHQVDVDLCNRMGEHIAKHFPGATKVVTIETSGIAIAYGACLAYGNIPMVFAKKQASKITGDNNYVSLVKSFTKGLTYPVTIDKRFLVPGDKVVIVDDFLASGSAGIGLVDICRQAGVTILGFAVAVEKSFQGGREELEKLGIPVYSCANIKAFIDNKPVF